MGSHCQSVLPVKSVIFCLTISSNCLLRPCPVLLHHHASSLPPVCAGQLPDVFGPTKPAVAGAAHDRHHQQQQQHSSALPAHPLTIQQQQQRQQAGDLAGGHPACHQANGSTSSRNAGAMSIIRHSFALAKQPNAEAPSTAGDAGVAAAAAPAPAPAAHRLQHQQRQRQQHQQRSASHARDVVSGSSSGGGSGGSHSSRSNAAPPPVPPPAAAAAAPAGTPAASGHQASAGTKRGAVEVDQVDQEARVTRARSKRARV